MTDVFTKEKRSEIMRAIKSSGNKSTEKKLMSFFKKYNLKGWRRNYNIIGKPDFVFLKMKIAIFTDGCFWHGHNCRNTKPKDNRDYWKNKIKKNIERDQNVTERLTKKGWTVIRIWECELKNENLLVQKFNLLISSSSPNSRKDK